MGKTMEQYIAEISKVLKQNIANREKIVEPVCNVLYEDKSDRLVIIASGSSYNAAVCAEAFMKHYLGERVKIQTPFSFTCYEKVKPTDAYLFVSQSGSSTNMIEALEKCNAYGIRTVAIVGKKDCDMGRKADVTAEYGVGEETVGYVTKGMSTLTLFFMLLAMECARKGILFAEESGDLQDIYEKDLQDLEKAAENHNIVYRYAKDFCKNKEKAMLSMKHVFFLGCGANIGTAREGALKLSEMLHVQTNDFEIEEFLHGPDLQLTPEYTLFFIQGGDRAGERTEEIYEAAREVTDMAYMISVKEIPVSQTKERVTPLYLTAFFQYLAYYSAKKMRIIGEHPLFARFEQRISCKTENYVEEAPF